MGPGGTGQEGLKETQGAACTKALLVSNGLSTLDGEQIKTLMMTDCIFILISSPSSYYP